MGVRHGTGQHQTDLTPHDFSAAMKVSTNDTIMLRRWGLNSPDVVLLRNLLRPFIDVHQTRCWHAPTSPDHETYACPDYLVYHDPCEPLWHCVCSADHRSV